MNEPLRVLLIDDSVDDREAVARILAKAPKHSFEITAAEDGKSALAALVRKDCDCALLDFSMPGDDGLVTLSEMLLRWPELPVIMMTGSGNERIAVESLKGGAQDYIAKAELAQTDIAEAIERAIESKQREIETLRYAHSDPLTGLANRRKFEERLQHALSRTGSSCAHALILFDLNGFKGVNDTHGHAVGDELLKRVAGNAAACLRPGDTLARLGGDEFVLLLENLPGDGGAAAGMIAERLESCVRGTSVIADGDEIGVGVSIGIALYPKMADSASDLLRIADEAMYHMKRNARVA